MNDTSPIIILGMHRSGTSMISDMLSAAGIFMGYKKNIHGEADFFLRINDTLLAKAHAYWDYPLPFYELLADETYKCTTVNELQSKIASADFKKNYLHKCLWNYKSMPPYWGWKDPRTTITFPLWHEIFPRAKYIFVYRNGIDVAHSLYVREQKRNTANPILSLRCKTIEKAFALWEEYNDFFWSHAALIHNQTFILRYEDFINDTDNQIMSLMYFLGVEKNKIPKTFSQHTKSENGYKFTRNPLLTDLYHLVKNKPLMQRYGYDKII